MIDPMNTSRLFSKQDPNVQFATRASSRMAISALCVLLCVLFAPGGLARYWRVTQLPNGQAFSCANCHVSAGGGGARNSFGVAVEQRVSQGGFEDFWDAQLAALDSDG